MAADQGEGRRSRGAGPTRTSSTPRPTVSCRAARSKKLRATRTVFGIRTVRSANGQRVARAYTATRKVRRGSGARPRDRRRQVDGSEARAVAGDAAADARDAGRQPVPLGRRVAARDQIRWLPHGVPRRSTATVPRLLRATARTGLDAAGDRRRGRASADRVRLARRRVAWSTPMAGRAFRRCRTRLSDPRRQER